MVVVPWSWWCSGGRSTKTGCVRPENACEAERLSCALARLLARGSKPRDGGEQMLVRGCGVGEKGGQRDFQQQQQQQQEHASDDRLGTPRNPRSSSTEDPAVEIPHSYGADLKPKCSSVDETRCLCRSQCPVTRVSEQREGHAHTTKRLDDAVKAACAHRGAPGVVTSARDGAMDPMTRAAAPFVG
ncbi:unnamed protein product [Lampetra fluviatilis]